MYSRNERLLISDVVNNYIVFEDGPKERENRVHSLFIKIPTVQLAAWLDDVVNEILSGPCQKVSCRSIDL